MSSTFDEPITITDPEVISLILGGVCSDEELKERFDEETIAQMRQAYERHRQNQPPRAPISYQELQGEDAVEFLKSLKNEKEE